MAQSLIEKLDSLPPEKKAMLNRLRRVEGQIRGIQRMILEDKDCYDVILQLSAARKALQNACIGILRNYIILCMADWDGKGSMDVSKLEKLIEALMNTAPIRDFEKD